MTAERPLTAAYLDRRAIARGSHFWIGRRGPRGACVMEHVSLLLALEAGLSVDAAWEALTDTPSCTDPLIADAAAMVNDNLSDRQRRRLRPMIPRLMRAHCARDSQRAWRQLREWLHERYGESLDDSIPNDDEMSRVDGLISQLVEESSQDQLVGFLDELLERWEKILAEDGSLAE